MRTIFAIVLLLITLPARATNFYFADDGSDTTNDCETQETPCLTIDKANNLTLSPGDSVLFKRDDIWLDRTTLEVPASGSSGSPITYGAYGTGDDPIISMAVEMEDEGWKWCQIGATDIYFLNDNATCGSPEAPSFDGDSTPISCRHVEAGGKKGICSDDYLDDCHWNFQCSGNCELPRGVLRSSEGDYTVYRRVYGGTDIADAMDGCPDDASCTAGECVGGGNNGHKCWDDKTWLCMTDTGEENIETLYLYDEGTPPNMYYISNEQYALDLANKDYITVENIDFEFAWDFVLRGGDYNADFANHIILDGIETRHGGKGGMQFNGRETCFLTEEDHEVDIAITDSAVHHNAQMGLVYQGNYPAECQTPGTAVDYITGLVIDGSSFNDNGLNPGQPGTGVGGQDGIKLFWTRGAIIRNSTFYNNLNKGMNLDGCLGCENSGICSGGDNPGAGCYAQEDCTGGGTCVFAPVDEYNTVWFCSPDSDTPFAGGVNVPCNGDEDCSGGTCVMGEAGNVDSQIYNNTSYDNGGIGILYEFGASGGLIHHNSVYDNCQRYPYQGGISRNGTGMNNLVYYNYINNPLCSDGINDIGPTACSGEYMGEALVCEFIRNNAFVHNTIVNPQWSCIETGNWSGHYVVNNMCADAASDMISWHESANDTHNTEAYDYNIYETNSWEIQWFNTPDGSQLCDDDKCNLAEFKAQTPYGDNVEAIASISYTDTGNHDYTPAVPNESATLFRGGNIAATISSEWGVDIYADGDFLGRPVNSSSPTVGAFEIPWGTLSGVTLTGASVN